MDPNSDPDTPSANPPTSSSHAYATDRPILTEAEDRFGRAPFARRIADTISNLEDPSSIVIGIYGAWGEGKTSLLNLMGKALRDNPRVVLLRFDPWLFESNETLLGGFFKTLAEGLGKSLPTFKEKVGGILRKYGGLFSGVSVPIPDGAGTAIDPGSSARALGDAISSAEPQEMRQRIEDFLRAAQRRIVVLIDDIDRMDRTEIQTLFKIIKLSADFPFTAYVLAFDDNMVSAVLGERYGAANADAGRNFLEKIVQVPLHLPPADQLSLRQITFEGVDAAVRMAGIELTEEHVQAFGRHFVDGLEVRLKTPRQARRYANALTFALPILKGDVHPVDQMLVEGLRVFYPALYVVVRDNPDLMIRGSERGGRPDEQIKKRTQEVIGKGLEGLLSQEDEAAKNLLQTLFPRLKSIYGNISYGSDIDDRYVREQRVATEWYFGRYFHYGVPPGDISDLTIHRLLDEMVGASPEQADRALHRVLEKGVVKRFIAKLRHQAKRIGHASAGPLARSLARQGAQFRHDAGGPFSFLGTHDQAAILIGQLVGLVQDMGVRTELAKEIMREATPLPFASECFRWLRNDEKTPESKRTLLQATEEELGKILAARIREAARVQPPYIQFRDRVPALLWAWDHYGTPGEVRQYLSDRFAAHPFEAATFLGSLTGKAWGAESGLPLKADFRRESYDTATRLIDPELIMQALRRQYGAALDTPDEYLSDEHAYEERLAHQFAAIHQAILKEQQAGANDRNPVSGETEQIAADEPGTDHDGEESGG
jgi:DNA-binding Lrp family transcriptional regulator